MNSFLYDTDHLPISVPIHLLLKDGPPGAGPGGGGVGGGRGDRGRDLRGEGALGPGRGLGLRGGCPVGCPRERKA